jgi:hypothetical protein
LRIGSFIFLVILLFCPFTMLISTAHSDEAAPRAREVVAVVNGEEIYLDELEEAVATRHRDMNESTTVEWIGYADALNRLISSRLVVQEALDVGLDERPEIRDKVQRFADQTLVKLVRQKLLREVEAEEDDTEGIFRDEVRRWRFKVIAFEDLDQAKAFQDEIKGGGEFEEVGEKYVKEGLAAWEGPEQEVRETEIAPEISAAFIDNEVGAVAQTIKAEGRFFVFKLTGVSYPDDPAARERAARKALIRKGKEVLSEHTAQLLSKYASVNKDVLATIGKGDFTDVKSDERIVAEIPGESPVKVTDLLRHLEGKSYHGGNISEHVEPLTTDPESVLRDTLEKTLYLKEARRLRLEETGRYLEAVKSYERSLVFGMYIEEFLLPQARLTDEEIRAAYEARKDEFLMPQTIKVESLTFTGEDNARNALDRLNRGADMKWLSRNIQGLIEDHVDKEELSLDFFPQDLRADLAEAAPGDTGLYELTEGTYKVFVVRELPPRAREPFEKVRPMITKELFSERMNQIIEDLAAELRNLSEITIYEDKLDKNPLQKGRDVY